MLSLRDGMGSGWDGKLFRRRRCRRPLTYGEVPFLAWPESPDTNERGNSKLFVAGPRALQTRAPPRLTSEGIQTIHRLYRLFLIFYISMSVFEQATKVTGHKSSRQRGLKTTRRPGTEVPRIGVTPSILEGYR